YGVERWNFPALYEQWDFAKQDYKDVNAVWESREPATFVLSVRAFSQRYINTDEKFAAGDYNMEGYWQSKGLLDNQRTMRVMKPMTKDELFNKVSTANDTRYWTANIRLKAGVSVSSLGKVAAPTAVMTDAGDNYYIKFNCSTEGATILYNHNFISPSYTPTSPYGDTAVIVPKSAFPSGTVTMTARAVKDGYTDAGVVTLTLKSSGTEANPEAPGGAWSDVPDTWYTAAVEYVMGAGLFDEQGKGLFAPDAPMTREMFITALYRLDGKPAVTSYRNFSDVTKGTPLSAAVSWAFDAGITTGTGDGSASDIQTFSPELSITREQIAAMFYRYAKHKGRDLSAKGDLSVFPDSGDTSSYGVEPLTWANGVKLINGSTGYDGIDYLLPKGTTTRAQCAQMFKNYGV
ncbi:MAG: S-layer homology domain-containing protein, partial [Oscillospiraceae bacterium]|nr:S-layer homology domain-containing protein [Oscillospiraceae bacterium]